jgi:FkbM family methyltransferase
MNVIKRAIYAAAGGLGYHIGLRPPTGDTLEGHLRTLFDRVAFDCVIDVGAHHGDFGRLVRTLGYRGRIVSFEPVAANFARLQEASSADSEWRIHNFALGAKAGRQPINVTRQSSLPSLRSPSAYGREYFQGQLDIVDTPMIDISRLDDVFAECVGGLSSPRVFLKLDTQGYDAEVLRGGAGSLGRVLAIQSELSVQAIYEGVPSYTDAIAELNALGFELSGLFPITLDRKLRLIEMDCVMIRAEATQSTSTPT